jgi:hypothetical protein
MVVLSIRRLMAVLALCAGLGAVVATPASAVAPIDATVSDIYTPPYSTP